MLRRIRFVIACLASLALLCVLIYGGLKGVGRPGNSACDDTPSDAQPNALSNAEPAEPNGFSHKSMELCENCHESNTPDETKARELARQVPQLCYQCHEDESKTFPHVHGPVAVGQCLFCHDPHRSEHPYLLKRDALALCALCHTRAGLASVAKHLESSHANCLECHMSHASQERFLLKAGKS